MQHHKIIFIYSKLNQFLRMWKDFIPQISQRDLCFQWKYNGKSSKYLREIKYYDIFYICLTKLVRMFFRDPFSNFIFENGEEKTIFYFLRWQKPYFAPKFEILRIPYWVACAFFQTKLLLLLKLQVSFSWKTNIL